jgi:tetratricopeptide (TPR) repeat protein
MPYPLPASERRTIRLAAAGLVALVLAAYANSFQGAFVLDDIPAIIQNPSIRRLWPIGDVLFPTLGDQGVTTSGRPLINLSLALNYAVTGESVAGFHAVNVAIHALAALLLFGIVRRTLLQPRLAEPLGGGALPLAVSVAALWALHPIQTAAVTYIVQRAESLAGLFYLLTLYGFVRATGSDGSGVPGAPTAVTDRRYTPRKPLWLGVSVAACLAGMASKEVVATAPLMVLLYDRTFVAGSFGAAWRARRGYYLALWATWLALAALVAGTAGRGGTAGFGAAVTLWEYALTQCGAIVQYLRLVLWPHPLVFDYGVATAGGLAEVWWQALVIAGLVAATGFGLLRRRVAGFLGAWFFLMLAPSSSVVPVATQTMAEHRMYLALAAPVALLVVGLHRALGRRAWPVAGALALAAGVVTVARNADYATPERLWADTIAKRPANSRAHHNLGLAEEARGRFVEAERHLRRAVELAPGTPEPLYNLALAVTRQGRPEDAMALYREAIRIEPAYAAAHNNLANLLLAAGRSEEAGRHYAEAVRAQPDFAGARNSYGAWLIDVRRPAEALAQLEEALRLEPGVAETHFNAGNACAALGRLEAATAYYRAALSLQPDHAEAHNNLGNVLLELDRLPEALPEFEAALRLQPDYFAPRRTLALLLLLHLNRPAEARGHLEILARARPADPEIAQALARARASAGGR